MRTDRHCTSMYDGSLLAQEAEASLQGVRRPRHCMHARCGGVTRECGGLHRKNLKPATMCDAAANGMQMGSAL